MEQQYLAVAKWQGWQQQPPLLSNLVGDWFVRLWHPALLEIVDMQITVVCAVCCHVCVCVCVCGSSDWAFDRSPSQWLPWLPCCWWKHSEHLAHQHAISTKCSDPTMVKFPDLQCLLLMYQMLQNVRHTKHYRHLVLLQFRTAHSKNSQFPKPEAYKNHNSSMTRTGKKSKKFAQASSTVLDGLTSLAKQNKAHGNRKLAYAKFAKSAL